MISKPRDQDFNLHRTADHVYVKSMSDSYNKRIETVNHGWKDLSSVWTRSLILPSFPVLMIIRYRTLSR